MSSKRRLRRKGCGTKVRHASLENARCAAALARKRGEKSIHAYGCRFCGGFHIGHRPATIQRVIDARIG